MTQQNWQLLTFLRDHAIIITSIWVWTDCRDKQELFRNHLHTYLDHGGKLLQVFDNVLFRGPGSIYWLPELLFRSSESWTVDELSPVQICLIGALARVDTRFRKLLKSYLASCRSSFYPDHASSTDRLYECNFGTDSIVRHFRMLEGYDSLQLLKLLCRTGSASMLQIFVETGIGVDWYHRNMYPYSATLLGVAAARGDIDLVHLLIRAGMNGLQSLQVLLKHGQSLSSDPFHREILVLLVENAAPPLPPINLRDSDPLETLCTGSGERALVLYPEVVQTLLNRHIFHPELLFGRNSDKSPVEWSYMFKAIKSRHGSVVDVFLQNGVRADGLIADLFMIGFCPEKPYRGCTWLTLSVFFGSASCVDVLVQHGADITALDGAGRSAIQLAKANARGPHPRRGTIYSRDPWHSIYFYEYDNWYLCSAENDIATLAVVERAFNLKFKGSKSFEDYADVIHEPNPETLEKKEKPPPTLRGRFSESLKIIYIPYQRRECIPYTLRRLWRMPFQEALLMRSLYVLSYVLLLATEALAVAMGVKKIPKPSRSLLSTVAILALVLIWGSWCFE